MPPPPSNRRSGIVVPHPPKWHQRLVAWLVWFVASAVMLTIRYRLRDPHGFTKNGAANGVPKPAILCTWHNRLALCVKLYHKYIRPQTNAPGLAGLVSASRDGALLAAIFARFAVQPVRGSSSRRGAQALMELSTWGERGYDLALTPDGPRGPRYKLSEGAITLAQVTGLPLVVGVYHLNWKITVNSWDRFQIPLPFARCELRLGKIFRVPRTLTDDEREQFRQAVETEMQSLTED